MRYDELQHVQRLRNYCGRSPSYSMTGQSIAIKRMLKKLNTRRQRAWQKKLTEVEMNTLRESYRSPDSPYSMEWVQGGGSPSGL